MKVNNILILAVSVIILFQTTDGLAGERIDFTIEGGYALVYTFLGGIRPTYNVNEYVGVGFDFRVAYALLILGFLAGPDIEINFSKEDKPIDPSIRFGNGVSYAIGILGYGDTSFYSQTMFCLNFHSPQRSYTPFAEFGAIISRIIFTEDDFDNDVHIIIQGGVKF